MENNFWYQKDLAGKNALGMAIICIVLGAFGIHNFLMGETKKGIVKVVGTLLCGIVGSILAWYDMIKIVTDKYTVDTNGFI